MAGIRSIAKNAKHPTIFVCMQPTIAYILHNNFTFGQKVKFFWRFFKWQVISKVFKREHVFRFTPNSKLVLIKGFYALSGNYYFGIAELDTMPFVLHVLQPGDLFVDVGANGGAFSVLASGEKGARSVAIEAEPVTFKGLIKNIELNKLNDLVEAWPVAVSDVNGYLPLTTSEHATNSIIFEDRPDIIKVKAKTLDSILNGRIPTVMKLDIEGYEHNALLGAQHSISNDACKALVIEFSDNGAYYGYGNTVTHELLTGYGFKPHRYHYKNKQIESFDPLAVGFDGNMIYIRDVDFIQQRLAAAGHVNMSGEYI